MAQEGRHVITAVEPQAKANSRRVNVLLDGAFAFSLAEELAASLSPGRALSESEIADLRRRDDLHKAYDAAIIFLSYRSRSVAEVRARLLKRGFDGQQVEEVLARLADQRLLGDGDFARSWVENRQAHSPRGRRMLGAELRLKGVDRETIDGALPAPLEEAEAAYRAGERKARALASLGWPEFRRKLGEHLLRRGFGYETAAEATRRLWGEAHGAATAADGDEVDGIEKSE